MALIYTLISPSVYKAEIFFLPPLVSDIQPLNVQNIRSNISVKSVYDTFKQNLNSRSLQRNFFNADTGLADDLFYSFSSSLKVIEDENSNKLSLIIEWSDAQQAADLVNQYSSMVESKTKQQLINNLTQLVAGKIKNIEYQIESKQKIAKRRVEDKISQLSDSLRIASGIKQNKQTMKPDATNTVPCYPGADALKAEINILKERKNYDYFIEGLRDLQERLMILRNIKINEDEFHAVTVDQQAYPPEYRIKPKRQLIVTLGFVLGLMFGVLVAFFINYIENQKPKDNKDEN